ncbi:MAG: 3'(2'),5'-bisphosphate nucleotidase CysQ [Cytophagales bacterium]|nr:3'(2'),5'-bisphosphate nucleotidase CysQ [Cytophagales bacterium]
MQDSNARSFIKGVTWRMVGSLDTLTIAFIFTGSLEAGAKIAGVEVITKLILYYFHERGWNFIPWGRKSYGPTKWRSITKVISWRAIGSLDTFLIAYFMGRSHVGDDEAAGIAGAKIAFTEMVTKPILYYFHERVWGNVKWGRIKGDVNPTLTNKNMIEDIKLEDLVDIAQKAGDKILDIYENEDFSKTIDFKADDSPLTVADKASHEIIDHALELLDLGIPVLSEEGKQRPYEIRKEWKYFWCVDPLDGTKEFINKNGEFTVNIALIKGNEPILGIVYAPVLNTTYVGKKGEGAYMIKDGVKTEIKINEKSSGRIAVKSKSHSSEAEDKVLSQYDVTDTISVGSSLKFCMVAEGKADIYYRHGPTMEWDTAAGQAVVEGAGGTVLDADNKPFGYNKENLLNGSFLALGF